MSFIHEHHKQISIHFPLYLGEVGRHHSNTQIKRIHKKKDLSFSVKVVISKTPGIWLNWPFKDNGSNWPIEGEGVRGWGGN